MNNKRIVKLVSAENPVWFLEKKMFRPLFWLLYVVLFGLIFGIPYFFITSELDVLYAFYILLALILIFTITIIVHNSRNQSDMSVFIKEDGVLYRIMPIPGLSRFMMTGGLVGMMMENAAQNSAIHRDKDIAKIAQARLGYIFQVSGVTDIEEREKDFKVKMYIPMLGQGPARKPQKITINKKFTNVDSLIAELRGLQ